MRSLSDLSFLKSKADDVAIHVEKRVKGLPTTTTRVFGRGQEVEMKFGELLKELEQGSEEYYLTTQDLPLLEDDRPDIMTPPVTQLQGYFPLRPTIMGHLIPQNLNIWMGQSQGHHSTSTGLHHDYHDNLYVLLRGKKRFRLYSPGDADKMYTVGEVVRVHGNGRINYEGLRMTQADGRDMGADRAREAARQLEEAAVRAFGGRQGGERGVSVVVVVVMVMVLVGNP